MTIPRMPDPIAWVVLILVDLTIAVVGAAFLVACHRLGQWAANDDGANALGEVRW
jgi:hypothetical protein